MATEVNRWESMGLGKAPFKVVGMYELPSKSLAEHNPTAYENALRGAPHGFRPGTCGVCGTALTLNYMIQSADGQKFCVGCECVQKTGDTRVVKEMDAERRKRNRELAREKREAKRLAREAEREVVERAQYGGKTRAEVRIEANQLWQAHMDGASARAAAILAPIASLIDDGQDGASFCSSIAASMRNGEVPRGRGYSLAIEIAAKARTGARRGSKAYEAAYDELERVMFSAQSIIDSVPARPYGIDACLAFNETHGGPL